MADKFLLVGFWLPFVLCTYLAFAPSPPESVFRISDVILHGIAFSYLTFALSLCYFPKRFWAPAAWMLGYALSIEAIQSLQPERSAELQDIWVDIGGIAIGGVLIRHLTDAVRTVVDRVTGLLARRSKFPDKN